MRKTMDGQRSLLRDWSTNLRANREPKHSKFVLTIARSIGAGSGEYVGTRLVRVQRADSTDPTIRQLLTQT